jgi:predicted nuclease with TOPRIM domain
MTDEKEIVIKEFRDKFAKLTAICDRLRADCKKLELSKHDLEIKLKAKESDYQQLKLRCENMKTVISLLDSKDKHDAKIYLNRIVRDIDKCLSMLLD